MVAFSMESSDGITRAPKSEAIIGGAKGERWRDDMEQLLLEMGPDDGDNLLQEAVRWGNVLEAYRRVKQNKGAPGPDGMTVEVLGELLRSRWPEIQASLESGTYQPQRVRRVEIPKDGGGKRKLGIPCVLDRLVQQMVLQVLAPLFDPYFSEWSYGFRRGRGTQDAVLRARTHVKDGFRWTVDLDLEKFFDRVNHDVLMARVARKVKDKRVLRLIRQFLEAGCLEGGLASPKLEGTPQGGPLSPLLSNILLDDLDKELESRKLRFVRYADDLNVYVKSKRAAERVLASVTRFLRKKLRLKVNEEKSKVDRPWNRVFLGYTMTSHRYPKLRVAPEKEKRLKSKFRDLLRQGRGSSIASTLPRLSAKIRGWVAYYRLCDVKAAFDRLDGWMRRRVRALLWRHWKNPRTRRRELVRRGIDQGRASISAFNGRGAWWNAGASHMNQAIKIRQLQAAGLLSFQEEFQRLKGCR
jgi:RNA-directed DNA polymerase